MIEIKRWWDTDFFLDKTYLLRTLTMSLHGTICLAGSLAGACQPSRRVVTPLDVHTTGEPGVGH